MKSIIILQILIREYQQGIRYIYMQLWRSYESYLKKKKGISLNFF